MGTYAMIKELNLTNFRGIKQGQIHLSPLTMLVGPNNAGKTAILESLFLAPNPGRQTPYGDNALMIVHNLHKTLDSSGFAFLMLDYRAKQAGIDCKINGDLFSLEFFEENKQIFLTTNNQNPHKGGTMFGPEQNRRKAFAAIEMQGTGMSIWDGEPFIGDSLLINPSLIRLGYEYLRRNWASILNSGACRRVIKEVSELSSEKYSDITLEPFFQNTYALYAFRDDGKRIRLGDLGEGIQNYIIARILYEISEPKVLLWDDVESHFNPRILIRLAHWFSELIRNGKQVIVATHSIEALKLLAEPNKENTSILVTSLENNILKTRSLSLEDIDNFRESGIDVRMAEPFLL
jgi:hypothetical protein